MPQNKNLSADWREMLGSNWKVIQEAWLHRLGNLTLTGYNSEYSDRSFMDKKSMKDGFDDSPLRLNKVMKSALTWTPIEMEHRGKDLSAQAANVWPALIVENEAIRRAEMEEHQTQSAKYSIDDLDFDPDSRDLFNVLRGQIKAVGDGVVELCGRSSVVYRVYDFFVEVIPRKRRISLLLNLEFGECDDPSGRAEDAAEFSFIIHATQSGGVLFNLRGPQDVPHALKLIQQAYDAVVE